MDNPFIAVTATDISTRSGTGKDGKPYTLRHQQALFCTSDGARTRIRIPMEADQPPFAKGEYELDFNYIFVATQYGDLQVNRYGFRLHPRAAKRSVGAPRAATV